jgi:hypothetical protein
MLDWRITLEISQEAKRGWQREASLQSGSPNGLMSVGQFPEAGFHIVDESIVENLKNKTNNI